MFISCMRKRAAKAGKLMSSDRIQKNNFLVLGRAGMDLYADPPGTETEHAARFTSALGGSSANTAAGITRLGGAASLVSAVSDDAIGRFTLNELKKYGIKSDDVAIVSGEARNSLALVETRSENCQSVIYRNGAADFQVTKEHVRGIDLAPFGALILTGTCLAMQPLRGASLALIQRAIEADLPVILDIDYRPYSWVSRTEAAAICNEAAQLSDIIVGNDEEFALLAGEAGDSLMKAAEYASRPDRIIVHKMGERGAVTFADGKSFETGIFKVAALKPTGAGDAFLASFCASLAEGRSVETSVCRGSAAAAIVVTKVGCAPAMPTLAELEDFMLNHAQEI
jgi:5-dehydro-2-deoxygluconokinase